MGKAHLTRENRQFIEQMLNDKKGLTQIAKALEKSLSTVSREIKAHIVKKRTGGMGFRFNDCKNRYNCCKRKICPVCRADKNYKLCRRCGLCYQYCPDYEKEYCVLLIKPPYVCNGCNKKLYCSLEKSYYDASKAEEKYREKLTETRSGFSYTEDEIRFIDELISPLIKRGQSPHHIYVNNKNSMIVSERTIYNLIDSGLISARNIDLPRRVRFKPRKNNKKYMKVDKACRIGRDYDEYLDYMEKFPNTAVVQMDSVEGKKGGKVLLTLHFLKCEMMLAFLRDANTAQSVIDIFNSLYDGMGLAEFQNVFQLILTDNGTEFSNPLELEYDKAGNKRTMVFYCDPQAPYQKGSCERNHEFIRPYIRKGVDFGKYTHEEILLMMNHINSYGRPSLGNKCPYEVFRFFYGDTLLDLLGCKIIPPNDVDLTNNLFVKGDPNDLS